MRNFTEGFSGLWAWRTVNCTADAAADVPRPIFLYQCTSDPRVRSQYTFLHLFFMTLCVCGGLSLYVLLRRIDRIRHNRSLASIALSALPNLRHRPFSLRMVNSVVDMIYRVQRDPIYYQPHVGQPKELSATALHHINPGWDGELWADLDGLIRTAFAACQPFKIESVCMTYNLPFEYDPGPVLLTPLQEYNPALKAKALESRKIVQQYAACIPALFQAADANLSSTLEKQISLTLVTLNGVSTLNSLVYFQRSFALEKLAQEISDLPDKMIQEALVQLKTYGVDAVLRHIHSGEPLRKESKTSDSMMNTAEVSQDSATRNTFVNHTSNKSVHLSSYPSPSHDHASGARSAISNTTQPSKHSSTHSWEDATSDHSYYSANDSVYLESAADQRDDTGDIRTIIDSYSTQHETGDNNTYTNTSPNSVISSKQTNDNISNTTGQQQFIFLPDDEPNAILTGHMEQTMPYGQLTNVYQSFSSSTSDSHDVLDAAKQDQSPHDIRTLPYSETVQQRPINSSIASGTMSRHGMTAMQQQQHDPSTTPRHSAATIQPQQQDPSILPRHSTRHSTTTEHPYQTIHPAHQDTIGTTGQSGTNQLLHSYPSTHSHRLNTMSQTITDSESKQQLIQANNSNESDEFQDAESRTESMDEDDSIGTFEHFSLPYTPATMSTGHFEDEEDRFSIQTPSIAQSEPLSAEIAAQRVLSARQHGRFGLGQPHRRSYADTLDDSVSVSHTHKSAQQQRSNYRPNRTGTFAPHTDVQVMYNRRELNSRDTPQRFSHRDTSNHHTTNRQSNHKHNH